MMERRDIKKLLRQAMIIVLVAAITGFAVNLFHPRGFEFVAKEVNAVKTIVYVTAHEARIKHGAGKALFVDTRDAHEITEGRIPGSILIPARPESLSVVKIREHFNVLSGDVELVMYCDSGCDSGEVLARRIAGMGYSRNIYGMTDGFSECRDKGYPVERGGTD
jgi:rhodanese-related sulfurtransferase